MKDANSRQNSSSPSHLALEYTSASICLRILFDFLLCSDARRSLNLSVGNFIGLPLSLCYCDRCCTSHVDDGGGRRSMLPSAREQERQGDSCEEAGKAVGSCLCHVCLRINELVLVAEKGVKRRERMQSPRLFTAFCCAIAPDKLLVCATQRLLLLLPSSLPCSLFPRRDEQVDEEIESLSPQSLLLKHSSTAKAVLRHPFTE